MKIRGKSSTSPYSALSLSSLASSSSSSPATPCSSSPPHSSSSSITTHSLTSSQDSSDSWPLGSSVIAAASPPRCHGLDLLVKAIHQVCEGSVVGVPYIQRRVVIRRRRRELKLSDGFVVMKKDGGKKASKKGNCAAKRQKRKVTGSLPLKYQDSVLQSWKPKSRGRRSVAIGDEICS